MGEQAPRSRRCGTSDRDWDGDRDDDRDEAVRRAPRRCRVILYVVGGLLGPGYWLCGVVWDGRLFGKSPAEARFTEFVLASAVVVVASWGLLLILGEAMLFALAVFKADDRERYDIYRNLMILWGYVLTLGIPRHFRKLPAQFGARPDDVRSGARGRGGQGAGRSRQRTDRPGDGCRDGAHHHGGGPAQERPDPRGTGARRRQEPRDRDDRRDHDETRDRTEACERDHTGCPGHSRDHAGCRSEEARDRTTSRERTDTRRRADSRDAAPDHGSSPRHVDPRNRAKGRRDGAGMPDVEEQGERTDRERAGKDQGRADRRGSREGEDARKRAARERTEPPGVSAGSRGGAPRERTESGEKQAASPGGAPRKQTEPPGTSTEEQVASLGAAPRQRPGPLGPIFPPRPAAEAEVGPVPGPPAASGPVAVTASVVSSLADTLPAGDTELRNALELLLRYTARCGGDETAVHRPAQPDPEVRDSKPFGIAAEAGGDV